jgi:hypothetical protein
LEVEVDGRERWERAAAREETESAMLRRALMGERALWIGSVAAKGIS